jgi:hypothetical protein
MLCHATDNPASCEIRAVIRLLRAIIMNHVQICRELCAVYEQNVMSERTVRQWCRMFKNGRKNIHDEERSDRPTEVLKVLTKKFVKDGASQFQNLLVNFHKFHALFSTRLSQLG